MKPETGIGWHRKGFKLYRTWKSRTRGGRPRIDLEIRTLIRRMARENPTWRAPRIHGGSSALIGGPTKRGRSDRPEDCRLYPTDIAEMVRDDCEMLEPRYLLDLKRAQRKLDEILIDSRPPAGG